MERSYERKRFHPDSFSRVLKDISPKGKRNNPREIISHCIDAELPYEIRDKYVSENGSSPVSYVSSSGELVDLSKNTLSSPHRIMKYIKKKKHKPFVSDEDNWHRRKRNPLYEVEGEKTHKTRNKISEPVNHLQYQKSKIISPLSTKRNKERCFDLTNNIRYDQISKQFYQSPLSVPDRWLYSKEKKWNPTDGGFITHPDPKSPLFSEGEFLTSSRHPIHEEFQKQRNLLKKMKIERKRISHEQFLMNKREKEMKGEMLRNRGTQSYAYRMKKYEDQKKEYPNTLYYPKNYKYR